MKFTTLLLLLATSEAIKINEAPAKAVAATAAVVAEVAPETKAAPEAPAGNETKPLTPEEIKQAKADAAWAKYKAKKVAFDDYIEEANLEGWRRGKNETAAELARYRNMTESIKVANEKEINLSNKARAIVKGENKTLETPDEAKG